MAVLSPDFQESNYHYLRVLAEKMMTLAELRPGSIQVLEKLENKTTLHYVRIFDDQELVRLF